MVFFLLALLQGCAVQTSPVAILSATARPPATETPRPTNPPTATETATPTPTATSVPSSTALPTEVPPTATVEPTAEPTVDSRTEKSKLGIMWKVMNLGGNVLVFETRQNLGI